MDIKDNLQRLIAGPCTVMHSLAYKMEGSIFPSRDNFKNDVEGAPEKIKIVLGWRLSTRE